MQTDQILESRLIAALVAEAKPESLAQFDHERFRLLSLTNKDDGGFRVDVDSTGLSLNDKVHTERILRRAAETYFSEIDRPQATLTTYFKRPGISSGNNGLPQPSASKASTAPFGVKFARRPIPGVKSVIAVASGKGGVGKSTVSSNLAVSLAATGMRVGFLDADIYGPSATLMFGVKGPVEVTPQRRLLPKMSHNVSVMSMGLLYDANSPAMWRGPMVVKALEQLIYDTDWGELDTLVIDLPPGTGDVQLTLIEKLPLTTVLIVSTPQDVALIDARKAFHMFSRLGIPVAGLIENMSVHRCGACGHEEAVFGEHGVEEFVKETGSQILARLPLAAKIRACGDNGRPAVLEDLDYADVFARLGAQLKSALPR